MDPITAISLVSGIISFITFGKDLVKGAIKIHESKDGNLEENQNREFVADKISCFCTILQPPDESKLAGEEKGLVRLAAKCHELAEDMAKVLDKIKAKDPNSRAQSVWAVLKAKVNEKYLMDFERRLDQCATQLHLQLTFFTSRHMTATLNGLVASASSDASVLERLRINVDQLCQSVDTINKEFAEQVRLVMQLQGKAVDTAIQQRILNSLRFEEMTRRYEMVEMAHQATFRWIFDASAFVYDAPLGSLRLLFGESVPHGDSDEYGDPDWDLGDEVDDEAEENDKESKDESDEDEENEHEENGDREDADEDDTDEDGGDEDYEYGEDEEVFPPRVVPERAKAYTGLTRQSIKAKLAAGKRLIHWLSSSDGIFHISGKMGSGKSTMMKLLYEHPATKYELERWAGTGILVFANFFFWKPGSDLQKNLNGLLRALLHATLETCQELVPVVMAKYWEQMQAQPWQNQSAIRISNKDIRAALSRLIQNPDIYNKHCFCFFIDGLDEYEGTTQEDQRYMVDLLLEWTKASRGKLKICVSSREHNIFMNAFQADKRIRLHEFTEHDMGLYVHDKLKHIPKANTREFLVREIPSRAHGIFLWTTLVVKVVRDQLENGATEDELIALLGFIPEELDDLFRHLFTSINKINRKRACQVFSLLLTGRKYDIILYLYGLSFLEEYEKNKRFAFLETPHKLEESQREATGNNARTRKQLNAWCKGLVEVVNSSEAHSGCQKYDLRHQVDFTHRSIYDFLESNSTMIDTDWQSTLRGFNAVDALSQITWATHKPTLTTCPRLFPLREIIGMRLGNALDKAPFEYLECLADGDRRHMTQSYDAYDDYVVGVVSVLYRDHLCYPVASRCFSSSQEPEVRNNTPDVVSCSFGILLLAVSEGHYGYLKWKIDNDPSSVDNSHKVVLLTCTLLEFTVSHRLSHPPASSSILALLFEKKLISPETMSFWAPGDSTNHPFFGKFPLDKHLKLTFREWIDNLELPNQDRLISLLERNERLEEEKLAQKAASEHISHDTEISGNLACEDNKPLNVGVMMEDEPIKPNKGGTTTTLAHISGQCAQITLLASGILIALTVQFLWSKWMGMMGL
ncbi:hypothetical protein DL768_010277 [Monosporascus sp. mg162]|nr:hypothetical protein DL768_010277 [Monosporascus sp. mg162]